MIMISKSELKAHMLQYFRQVEETGEDLIVTDHRIPVLKVSPLRDKMTVAQAFSDMRGKIEMDEKMLLEPETSEWGDMK